MSEKTIASQNPQLSRCTFSASERILGWLESVQEKGGHASVEEMVNKALTIYWKIVGQFGNCGKNYVQLWWPSDDWGDGARGMDLAIYFHAREGDITSVQTQEPLVRTFTMDVSPVNAERIRRTCARVGVSTFNQLVGLAVAFYEVLLKHQHDTSRGGPYLRIRRQREVTRRRWLRPWKTYKVICWDGWTYYKVHRFL